MNDHIATLPPYFRNDVKRTKNAEDGNYRHMGGIPVVRAEYVGTEGIGGVGGAAGGPVGWHQDQGINAELGVGVDRWW